MELASVLSHIWCGAMCRMLYGLLNHVAVRIARNVNWCLFSYKGCNKRCIIDTNLLIFVFVVCLMQRWQRRVFVLYDDGELTYSVDENVRLNYFLRSLSFVWRYWKQTTTFTHNIQLLWHYLTSLHQWWSNLIWFMSEKLFNVDSLSYTSPNPQRSCSNSIEVGCLDR